MIQKLEDLAIRIKERLKSFLELNQTKIDDFSEKIEQYEAHKERVSAPFREIMEEIKLSYNLSNTVAQAAFVYSYSLFFLKLTVFKHYGKLNFPIKLSLICWYVYSIEPFTLGSCKLLYNSQMTSLFCYHCFSQFEVFRRIKSVTPKIFFLEEFLMHWQFDQQSAELLFQLYTLICKTSPLQIFRPVEFEMSEKTEKVGKTDYISRAWDWYLKAREYINQLNRFKSLESDLTYIFYAIQLVFIVFFGMLFIRFVIADTYERFNFLKKSFITGLLILAAIPLDVLITFTVISHYTKSQRYQKKFEDFKDFLKTTANEILSKAKVS